MSLFLRVSLTIPSAAFITLLLLALMVSLIEFTDKQFDRHEIIKLPDILMPADEIEEQRIIGKPQKPTLDQTPPPEVSQQDFDKIDGNATVGKIVAGGIQVKMDLNIGTGLQASDGEYLPIVKVAPQYPRRALSRGIEGYVVLEYTVTKQGTTSNPVVIEAQPLGVFDKTAIKSALRYKYKPRVTNGEPVEVPGVRTRITFKLEE